MNMTMQELLQRFNASERDGEKLQHVLIGTLEGIQEATHTLHALSLQMWNCGVPLFRSKFEFIDECTDEISSIGLKQKVSDLFLH